MGVNKAALKNPSTLIKLLILCIDIIVIILARAGFHALPFHESNFDGSDHRWLCAITFGAYLLILGAILVTYLLGDGVSDKLEMIFMFTGCILFLASGSVAVQHHQNYPSGAQRDTGLSYGSLAIINGILCFVDCLLLAKQIKGK